MGSAAIRICLATDGAQVLLGTAHPCAAGDISPVLREPHTPLQASQPKQGVFIREIFLA